MAKTEEILHGDWLIVARKKRPNKSAVGAKNKEPINHDTFNKFNALFQEIREEVQQANNNQRGPSISGEFQIIKKNLVS